MDKVILFFAGSLKIFVGVVGIVLLVLYFAWKWKKASDYSDAEAEEIKIQKQSFESLKNDARFTPLKKYIEGKYKFTFENPADEDTYKICYLCLYGDKNQILTAETGAGAKYLAAYLDRKKKPNKIQALINLETNEVKEYPLNSFQWGAMVPRLY